MLFPSFIVFEEASEGVSWMESREKERLMKPDVQSGAFQVTHE